MTVCCPLSGGNGDYDGPSFLDERIRRAVKTHECCECEGAILPGAHYECASGKWDGDVRTYKTCLLCKEIRDHFGCEGWTYTALWMELEQNFFPAMTAGGPCFVGLSPQAKAVLFERRMAWLQDHSMHAHPRALYNRPRPRP